MNVDDLEPVTKAAARIFDQSSYHFDERTRDYRTWIPGYNRPIITTEEQHKAILRQYSNFAGRPRTVNELCAAMGWPRDVMMAYLHAHGMTHDREPVSPEELTERPTDDIIRDVIQEQRGVLLRGFNEASWKRTTADAKKWATFDVSVLDVFRDLAREGRATYPMPNPPALSWKPGAFDLIVPPADVHLDKDNVDGDNDVGAKLQAAADRLMAKVKRQLGRPARIIFADPGDWNNTDGPEAKTRHGTRQDVTTTHRNSTVRGARLQASLVRYLRRFAPVTYVKVPGNHDPTTGHAVYLYCLSQFESDPRVTVLPYEHRQYVRSGKTQIMVTHGTKTPRGQTLGQLMAGTERPDMWASTERGLVICGHVHHLTLEEQGRVEVMTLRSPNGADAWTTESGYVGSARGLTGIILEHDHAGPSQFIHSHIEVSP